MDPKIYLRNLPGNPGRNQETARVSVVERWTVSKRGHGGPRWGEGGGELEVEEVDVAVEGGIWWWSGGGELAVDEEQEGTSLRAPVPDLQS